MNYFIIGAVTLASYILGYMIISLYNFLLKKKDKKKFVTNKANGVEDDNKINRNVLLTEAFFELKENISILENIYESIKSDSNNKIVLYLKKIDSSKILEASKIKNFSKVEFELLDQLYSVIISRNKLEFNYELYKNGKINHLELRARTREYLDKAIEVSNDFFNKYIKLLN